MRASSAVGCCHPSGFGEDSEFLTLSDCNKPMPAPAGEPPKRSVLANDRTALGSADRQHDLLVRFVSVGNGTERYVPAPAEIKHLMQACFPPKLLARPWTLRLFTRALEIACQTLPIAPKARLKRLLRLLSCMNAWQPLASSSW